MLEDILREEEIYCSQGGTSRKHVPKKLFCRAEGSFLIDNRQCRFLDFQMCNSSVNFGYKHPAFYETMQRQLEVMPSLANEFVSEAQITLATKICKYMETKHGVKGRVHFSVGGAQAIDDALKIAASYTGSKNIFAFEGAYHGRTMAASSASSSPRYTKQFGSVLTTYRIPFPYCYRCAYAMEEHTCNRFCLQQFRRLFESEYYGVFEPSKNKSAYGAFLAEPILGRGGYVVPPLDYFGDLCLELRKREVPLIIDEIQMGLFRSGTQWAFENYSVVPDAFVFGKAMTNGLWPLSGVWANEKLLGESAWPPGSSHSTFAGNPIGMALGIQTLNLTADNAFQDKVAQNSKLLKKIADRLKQDYPVIGRVDQMGMLMGIELIEPETQKPNPTLARDVVENALHRAKRINGIDYGLVMSLGGFFENTLTLSPNLLICEDEFILFDQLFRHYLDLTLQQ